MTADPRDDERARLRARLHQPFRPRWGRWVPWAVAAAGGGVFVAVAAAYPGASVGDRLAFLAFAAVLVLLLSRFARVSALPDEEGLTVRNLVQVRRYPWRAIVSVSFGRDSTWAQLDLDDGTTANVMAIQQADGTFARREADRLATLVELHAREPGP
ncbi:MAG: PH domain-containing protein [Kineosporiaceae bacterium]